LLQLLQRAQRLAMEGIAELKLAQQIPRGGLQKERHRVL
jgi:hypothetical protein